MTMPPKKNGFMLISTLTALGALILLVSFYLHGIIEQTRMNQLANLAPVASAAGHAGIVQALYKLRHNSEWNAQFIASDSWTGSFTEDNVLANASTSVSAAMARAGEAQMHATSTALYNGTTGRRVFSARVHAPLSPAGRANTAVFARNDITSINGSLSITGGDIFANNNISASVDAAIATTLDVYAGGTAATSTNGSISANAIHDTNNVPAPDWADMLGLDFDKTADNSYTQIADAIYTPESFYSAVNGSPAALAGINYVTGDAIIPRGANVTLNGMLIADGAISIGATGTSSAQTILAVNHVGGSPSGLASKRNIIFGPYALNATISGLVYAGRTISFFQRADEAQAIHVNGALIANDILLYPRANDITIVYNESFVSDSIIPAEAWPYVFLDFSETRQ